VQLEEMGAFFSARADIYDKKQIENIGGPGLYDAAAGYLPGNTSVLLDLGCGSGLELERVFTRFPNAEVVCIDLSEGLLKLLLDKFPAKKLTVLQADYFEYSYPDCSFDAVISAESLHHYFKEKKLSLYEKIHRSLKPSGRFVNADYIARDEEEVIRTLAEYDQIMRNMGNPPGLYHFDIPLTSETELSLMIKAGFARASMERSFGNSAIFTADK